MSAPADERVDAQTLEAVAPTSGQAREGARFGEVRLEGGGAGEVRGLEGEWMRVVVPRPFAPGAPMAFEVDVDGAAMPLRAKAGGSKKQADGRFEVTMRLVNLTRTDRARLAGG